MNGCLHFLYTMTSNVEIHDTWGYGPSLTLVSSTPHVCNNNTNTPGVMILTRVQSLGEQRNLKGQGPGANQALAGTGAMVYKGCSPGWESLKGQGQGSNQALAGTGAMVLEGIQPWVRKPERPGSRGILWAVLCQGFHFTTTKLTSLYNSIIEQCHG